jgi:hypothetical protein
VRVVVQAEPVDRERREAEQRLPAGLEQAAQVGPPLVEVVPEREVQRDVPAVVGDLRERGRRAGQAAVVLRGVDPDVLRVRQELAPDRRGLRHRR